MKTRNYQARFIYRDDGGLSEQKMAITTTSLKDAKIIAKNIAKQNNWRLCEVCCIYLSGSNS